MNVEVSECRHWAEGGKGASDLAKKLVKICKKKEENLIFFYKNNLKLWG